MGPYYQAFPEGGSLTIYEDDEARTYDEIARWSKKDAEAWPKWNAWLAGIADVMGPLLTRVPPNIGSHSPSDLADLGRLVWKNRGVDARMVADITRLMSMSIADLLDDWFESPQIKGALAVNGVIGTWAGPYAPGTAYVMAHHSIGDVGDGVSHSAQLGSWGYPEGGMGAVSAAIARSARTFGAELRTGTRVESVSTSNGHVTGVVLENGEQLTAPLVVTSLHPKTAFLDHLPRTALPDDFVSDIERWNTRSGVVKINLALAELPNFTADPSDGLAEHHTGSVEMSPTMDFIERAFQDAREGRAALLPFSDGVIPTTLDKTMNPDGTHIFSMFTQYVPHEWSEAPHTEELEAYTDRLIDLYDQVAPGFADSVTHRDIVGPHEMQEEYGLVGGNIFHGELTPEQLFHMRPAPGYADYRTPIAGLYNASSATHGGGGVCGIPGWQAAKAAISDKKSIRQRLRRRAG
jgi:phytoene dehydrogenase-like protein